MPDIDFRGYSGDCLIHGRLEVPVGIRLTDYLNTAETYVVHGASLFALEDGREVPAGDQELASEDLWAVEPTDTATRADLHVPTRAVAIDIDLPPYTITGFLHGVNTGDPVAGVSRRRRMIPITEATITFEFNGQPMSRDTGVLIVNRDRASSLRRSTMEKSKLDDIPLPAVDPRAQDLTGKIIYDRED
jgi:hypothetical protein